MVDWNREANALFVRAVKMSSPDQRVAFLDEACAGDPALRAEVEQLLKAHEEAGNFLERPLLGDQQTQNTLGSTDGDDPPDPPEAGSDPISLDYLRPSDAPDSLGRLGQYEVRELVGRGGMGVVLKANDTKLNRIVALKVLAPELASNAAARKRFVREARAVAAVSHHHVVTIYAVEEDPLPYLAMEFIDGQSLQEKIDRQGQLPLKEILRIGQQIAAGLAAAHGHGIIHRDIKPANVLLQDSIERVQITDFGLARAVDDVSITGPGEVAGTPQFMSPEQAQGQPVDPRSDLFSLGSVLYTMCTGRPPFRADTAVAVLRRICDDTARPIREVNPDVPEWLVEIVERLLAKRPEDRFQTAAEVAELLGRHLAHVQDPVSRPFPGRLPAAERRPGGRARRRRFWLAAALVLAIVVGSLGLTEATGVTQLTASLIRVVTGEGTLVVEVDDPQVSVTIDGEDLLITGAGPQEVRLKPGRYRVQAAKGGQLLKQELVTIARGGQRVVRVALEPSAKPQSLEEGFVSLFDGKTLRGWHPIGPGKWTIEDGAIVGRKAATEVGSGHLVSDTQFEDFVLRLKFKLLAGDSGVYFRSTEGGRCGMHGLQANLCLPELVGQLSIVPEHQDHDTNLVNNPPNAAYRYFKTNDWNDLSITAEGTRVLLQVNGLPTAEMTNAPGDRKGHIAFQLCTYRPPVEVMFKDIVLRAHAQRAAPGREPKQSERGMGPSGKPQPLEDGFVSLFDGETLRGWHPPSPHYWVESGKLVSSFSSEPYSACDANLFSEKEYADFVLRLEYRLSAGANSGVLLRTPADDSPGCDRMEVQIADDSSVKDDTVAPWQLNGALWGIMAPQDGHPNPVGQWNSLEITCQGRKIRVVLNGRTVLDGDLDEAARRPCDGRKHPGLTRDKGHIGFIGRGSENRVEYRNIRIRTL